MGLPVGEEASVDADGAAGETGTAMAPVVPVTSWAVAAADAAVNVQASNSLKIGTRPRQRISLIFM